MPVTLLELKWRTNVVKYPRSDRDRDDRRERDYDRRDRTRDDRRDRDRDRDRDRHRDRDAERERERGSGRRRSRSPGGHHHHPRGSSRRDYELDAYSSSRDYREREREDRYAGRDRRGGGGGGGGGGMGGEERGWERDRGPMPPSSSSSRRDPRWEEDERASRRERDLFDDRGDRRRRERDRDLMAGANAAPLGSGGRARKRSASPGPPKRREPTPDLTNIASVLDRKRRLTQWDIKPPGYENVTAEQAKLSGMFPLPGAPRQQPMDPSRLQAFINQPTGSATSSALKPSNARQSKRLFVYNLPPDSTESTISEFFNLQLNGLNVISSLDPCVSAQISKDRSYALLEFKTPEDTTVALALDGIEMEDTSNATNGEAAGSPKGLSIQRPKDYIVPTMDEMGYQDGVVSNVVHDTANKLCVSNIPSYITEEQVTELLVSFGELRAFVLVKDTGTEQSRVCRRRPLEAGFERWLMSTCCRALRFVNTLNRAMQTTLYRTSMAWHWAISIFGYSGQALACSRRPAWRWVSMPCRC